jgi:hypothetical protein
LVGRGLGRLVAVGWSEPTDEVVCSEGSDAAGSPPLHAVVARTTVAIAASRRIDFICQASASTLRPNAVIDNRAMGR